MNSLLSPTDEGDFLNHFMHEDDMFSDMLEPSFYTEQPTTTTATTTEPPPQPQPPPQPTSPPPDNHNSPKRKDRDTEKLQRENQSITKRLGPVTRRTSRSPPPLKRQALDPRRTSSSQRTSETSLREHSPSSYSRHSSTRFRSPALCSRSRSRTPPRASYRRSADRRGTSSDRGSLRTRSRHPLPPQNEARTNKSPPEKTTTTKSREENRQRSTNPDTVESKSRKVTKNHHWRSTDNISPPQKKISSSSSLSSSNLHSSRGEKSPSPPKAPAALRKYSLHHQSPPPSSPAQVARAAKAAAEASRLRNMRKREQIHHRLAPSSSTFPRPHSSSSHRPISRSITHMDDSEPPPTAPAADLKKEKQKQPPLLPSPHTPDAGVGNFRTGSSLTNRNRSSSHGSLTPSTMEDVSKAEGVDKSAEDVKGKVMEELKTDSESLAPPSKPDQPNRSPSLPKSTAPSRPPIPNPKKPLPKRYGPNHNNPGYWTVGTTDPNFDNHFGIQRPMQALPNSLNLNQMMIPNIGMTMNLLHNLAMNPNMAMMGGANMIPFMHTANRSARAMNYMNQGVDMNLGMGDAPPHGYGMEYQGLMQADMGMGMSMGGMNSPWAGSENEGMYNERYNYVSNGNADVNTGIMGMTDAVGYNYGNGVQNSWGYSGPSTDFGTNYGNGISTRTSGIRSRGTSTPTTHDSADARSVNSNATSGDRVGDGNNQLDTSNSKQPPKRRGPRSYNNHNPDVPLIRFVGTPSPAFPFSNFQPGQLPQFPNPGFFG